MDKKYKKRLVLKRKVKVFITKTLLSIILLLVGMILVKEKPELKDKINENIYERSIKFSKTRKIYNKYFGKIFDNKKTKNVESVSNEKITYESKQKYNNGVELKVDMNYPMKVLDDGVIIFIGDKKDYGPSIIIEQTNGVEIMYSNIINTDYKLYDYVEKGNILGVTKDNKIYLTFQKNGQYLDYEKYI